MIDKVERESESLLLSKDVFSFILYLTSNEHDRLVEDDKIDMMTDIKISDKLSSVETSTCHDDIEEFDEDQILVAKQLLLKPIKSHDVELLNEIRYYKCEYIDRIRWYVRVE